MSVAERAPISYAATWPAMVEAMLDGDGLPSCDPPDQCAVCVLVDVQRPGESRRDWLQRITAASLAAGVRDG